MRVTIVFMPLSLVLAAVMFLTLQAQSQVSYGISGGEQGVKFPVESLAVDTKTKFKTPTIIKIERYENGFFVTTKDTIVPTHIAVEQGNFDFKFLTQGVNVVWEFVKPGIRFETKEGVYVSEKAGATISFTKDGVQMKDIKKLPK